MTKNKKHKNKYNHYTEDFRREAVRRSEQPDTSAVEVARELGIYPGQIYNWRRHYKRLLEKQFNSMNGVDYSKQESEEIRKLKREIADLKEERDFLKKGSGVLLEPKSMKYAYVESLKGKHAIHKMCAWLNVSRSGYYKWHNREPSDQALQRELVRQTVQQTFERFKQRYETPRITVELNEAGIPCSLNHVASLMAESGLKARNRKNYKYFPSPNAIHHVSDNVLGRDFSTTAPDEKWVSDITYIKLERGFVYLAVIMDLFSRQIIGWSLDTSMTTDLIIEAFEMAKARRNVSPGRILHSDRGVQYRSSEYQGRLYDHDIRPSMSRKGNC
jgi:transposase-like protein